MIATPTTCISRVEAHGMVLVVGSGRSQRDLLFWGDVMKTVKHNRKIWLILISLFLLAALPAVTSAQGRGRGQEKKLDRFVNGHDAREGRWDGRGPDYGRRTGISNVIWHQRRGDRFRYHDFERNERFRNRHFELHRHGFDNNNFLHRQGLRHSRGYHYHRGFYRY